MDVFQMITIYYPDWSPLELFVVVIILLVTAVFLMYLRIKGNIDTRQMVAGMMIILWLLLVLGSTVFTRNPGERQYQLELFWSWKEILHPVGRIGAASRNGLLIENILNLFLLFPVGILLPIFLDKRMSWWQGLLVGICISGVVEILQLLLCRGLFEFDDIIHNGFGCMLGTVTVGRWKDRKVKMKNSTEKCIRCGKETEVPVETPVEKRYNYIEGSGQMCKECYEKVYGGMHTLPDLTGLNYTKSI